MNCDDPPDLAWTQQDLYIPQQTLSFERVWRRRLKKNINKYKFKFVFYNFCCFKSLINASINLAPNVLLRCGVHWHTGSGLLNVASLNGISNVTARQSKRFVIWSAPCGAIAYEWVMCVRENVHLWI